MKPKKNWFVRKAKHSTECKLCGEEIKVGDSVTRYMRQWPHLGCAKQHDALICAAD